MYLASHPSPCQEQRTDKTPGQQQDHLPVRFCQPVQFLPSKTNACLLLGFLVVDCTHLHILSLLVLQGQIYKASGQLGASWDCLPTTSGWLLMLSHITNLGKSNFVLCLSTLCVSANHVSSVSFHVAILSHACLY